MLKTTYFKKKTALLLFLLFFILFTSSYVFILNPFQNYSDTNDPFFEVKNLKTPQKPITAAQESLTAVWFKNPNLDTPIEPEWYSELEGDLTDIRAKGSSDQANFIVIGDSNMKNISDPLSNTKWIPTNNPEFPISPDFNGSYSEGLYINHEWNEGIDQTRNTPSIHWKRNVTMPINTSDYIITSASLEVVFNATVTAEGAGQTHIGGIEVPGDYTEGQSPPADTQFGIGDFATFYVLISDLNSDNVYQIAVNRTTNLGQDSSPGPEIYNHTDTLMDVIPEDVLISYLTSVLDQDGFNFTITLGIDIYCEDNEYNADIDTWDNLTIRSFNLTFNYEKKINQFNSISWNQDGEKISDISNDTVIINEAKLNFKYKIDNDWSSLSPNSEIRAFINHNKLSESIKLNKANSTFQIAKVGGFDVTSLVPYNVEINISLQVYIADEFGLRQNTTISLDDIYLNISYTVIFPDTQTNLEIFFNGINKTSNPVAEVPVNTDLNITVKYPDNAGIHISDAIVQLSGNLTGTLIENSTYEQYTIIINTNNLNIGNLHFDIVAHRINYEARKISPLLIVTKIPTEDLELFLNYEDKTNDPYFDIAINKLLNITVKYTDILGNHISGATLQLMGEGILEHLNESLTLQQYSIVINTTIKLSLGENDLTIRAQEENHQEKTIDPRLIVRRINTQITPVTGSNTIDILPGENAIIRVYINDTDFNTIVKGAIVTYIWGSEDGILSDDDDDGIYEGTIENIPKGTHSIIISARGSNIYSFENYEIVITAFKTAENVLLFQILLAIGIIASVGLGGYVYAYQKLLKFPKPVRKVRKFRRTLRKTNTPHVEITSRSKAFSYAYRKQTSSTLKLIKSKPSETLKIKKIEKKTPENTQVKDIDKTTKTNSKTNDKSNDLNKSSTKENLYRTSLKGTLRKFWSRLISLNKNNKFIKFSIILLVLLLNIIIITQVFNRSSLNISNKSLNPISYENIYNSGQDSDTKQWLNNTVFNDPIEPTWYSKITGDYSDVKTVSGSGQVNSSIIGDSGEVNIDNVLSGADWTSRRNPDLTVLPDWYEINSSGAHVAHTWDEDVNQTRNRPSVRWERDISTPVNFTDYVITSASLEVIFNATVTVSPHAEPTGGWGIDREGDANLDDYSTGDYTEFYVLISDIDETFPPIQVAYNNTGELGRDSPSLGSYSDSLLNTVPEDVLISVLTQVLENDGHNFTLTLGIDIYCEDNEYGVDRDRWDSLIIRSFNLSFTYEKKIDQFTTVSWNQDADKVSDLSIDTVVVDEALLNFKYKIDKNWTESSPNSEIRILFNGNQHPETVKLNTANGTFQEAKPGGFDVTALIIDEVNLSIQVYLADEFSLDRNITISIDDVTLNISYTIIFPDFETDLFLFLNKENKTDDPTLNLNVGEQLNITIKYLNSSGIHIPNATVTLSGNFTGTLVENNILEQYSIIIDTDISNIGINFLTVSAKLEDYELKIIYPIITINKLSSENLQILFNSDNVTLDPSIELVYGEELNITIKYTDLSDSHIPNATVRLVSEGLTRDLNESLIHEQYTLVLNTTERLVVGVNLLTIEAQEPNFQTGYAFLRVTIRKVNGEINTITGLNPIQTTAGNDITIRVNLNNTDFDGLIIGAIITYQWEEGDGILTDSDNDGIYEDTLLDFPNGTYNFEISAFAGDEYYIEDYDLIIVSISEASGPPIFQILAIVSAVIIAGLASYLYIYQKYLKFPKSVRKVRKYRKSLKRKTKPSTNIISREKAINSLYKDELHKSSQNLKVKPPVLLAKSGPIKKLPPRYTQISEPRKPELDTDKLIDKSLEKKAELDKIVDTSTKDNSL